jgi:Zn finger protein HypA/HybF involved in hydrogenase expression
MGRRDLSTIKAKVLAHNQLLKQYGLSLRTRRNWISTYNGISVSLDTLYRWDQEEEANRTVEPRKSDTSLGWSCRECDGKLTIEDSELLCKSCGLVYERVRTVEVDHGTQVESYQPALESSFHKGLGTPTTPAILRYAVRQAKERSTSPGRPARPKGKGKRKTRKGNQEYLNVLQLKSVLSKREGLQGPLEHLTRRLRQIRGFDPTSDKDQQFGELNELGRFLRQAKAQLRGQPVNFKKITDALLVVCYGEKARRVIERPEKRLRCPRCRRERPYAHDTSPEFFVCLKCGQIVSVKQARFNVSFSRVDPVYVTTVRRLLPKLPKFVESDSERERIRQIEQVVPEAQ